MPETDKDILRRVERAWVASKSDFWRFAKYLKTEDQQRKIRRSFPVPHRRYIVEGINDDAEVMPHLKSLKEAWDTRRLLPVLKSRRTFVTNACMGFAFHESFFCDKTLNESNLFCVTADEEAKAQRILARAGLMYDALPKWFKLVNPRIGVGSVEKVEFKLGGKMLAFSSSPKVYRSEGFTRILPDEFAFHPQSDESMGALQGSTADGGKIVVVSTPNGKQGAFYRLVKGFVSPDIYVHKVHWREIPGRDDAWKAALIKEMNWTREDWEREMEFSFESMLGRLMIEGFDYGTHVKAFDIGQVNRAMCSWDIGFECPAAVIWWINKWDQVCVQLAIAGHRPEGGMPKFIKEVKEYRAHLFPKNEWEDIVPHDAVNTSTESGSQYLSMFHSERIYPRVNANKNPKVGWDATRNLFNLRGDGKPGIIINENGIYLTKVEGMQIPEPRNVMLESLQGGFTRKQVNTAQGPQIADEPNRIHPFIDVMDALRCGIELYFGNLRRDGTEYPTEDAEDYDNNICQPVI